MLSACATVMPTPDAPDELTHLAAAFRLAGFRSVVATLWPARDLAAAETPRFSRPRAATPRLAPPSPQPPAPSAIATPTTLSAGPLPSLGL
ncbi:CHAT domain-containing protein [Streptomyces iakyrus]|uniref:CHAT domain-containing protein n=1 Tax=Streptomyces iakyrus TaxID=68219 RepID=UPI0036ED2994